MQIANARRQQILLTARWSLAQARQRLLRTCSIVSSDNVVNQFARLRRKVEWEEVESETLAELTELEDLVDTFGEHDSPQPDTDAIESELLALRQKVADAAPRTSESCSSVTP